MVLMQVADVPQPARDLSHAVSWSNGFAVAARLRGAGGGSSTGGDRFDVLPIAHGLVFVVGDVAGHGAPALAAAQRVRARIRASLLQGRSPGQALGQADAALSRGRFDMATAVVGAVDFLSGLVTWSVAGHLPPLFLVRDPRFGELTDVPLGVGDGRRRRQRRVPLPRRGMLLFTDGLIERRGQSLDDGLATLASVASRHRGLGVDMLCAKVMREMVSRRPADDVCVLVVRPTP